MGSDKVTTNIKCTFSQIKRDPFLVHTTLSKSVCYVLEKVLKKHSPSYTFAILQNISMNLSIFFRSKGDWNNNTSESSSPHCDNPNFF